MIVVDFDIDLVGIRGVYDGEGHQLPPRAGNFLGFYGIPPGGGWYWFAIDGDHGEAGSEDEARREIKAAWAR